MALFPLHYAWPEAVARFGEDALLSLVLNRDLETYQQIGERLMPLSGVWGDVVVDRLKNEAEFRTGLWLKKAAVQALLGEAEPFAVQVVGPVEIGFVERVMRLLRGERGGGRKSKGQSQDGAFVAALEAMHAQGKLDLTPRGRAAAARKISKSFPGYAVGTIRNAISGRYNDLMKKSEKKSEKK